MISVKWFNSLSSDSLLSEHTFSSIEYARDYICKKIAPLLDADDRLVIEEIDQPIIPEAFEPWKPSKPVAEFPYIENTANLWRR